LSFCGLLGLSAICRYISDTDITATL